MSGNVLAEKAPNMTSSQPTPAMSQMVINNQMKTSTAVAYLSTAVDDSAPAIDGLDDNNNSNNNCRNNLDAANGGFTTKLEESSKTEQQQQLQHQTTTSAVRTTPQSQSSSISTPTSSSSQGKMSGSNNSNNSHTTTSIGKFKEKRPEPLKLNPNLNQEIPLDLSTKR